MHVVPGETAAMRERRMRWLCCGARRAAPVLAAILMAATLPACESSGDTIYVSNVVDCGLIRLDVAGDWVVSYTAGAAVTVNCDNPLWNNQVVDVAGFSTVYSDVVSFASPSGAVYHGSMNDTCGSVPEAAAA